MLICQLSRIYVELYLSSTTVCHRHTAQCTFQTILCKQGRRHQGAIKKSVWGVKLMRAQRDKFFWHMSSGTDLIFFWGTFNGDILRAGHLLYVEDIYFFRAPPKLIGGHRGVLRCFLLQARTQFKMPPLYLVINKSLK